MGEPPWLELSVERPPPGEELFVAEALRRLGGRGVALTGGRVVAYVPAPHDTAGLRERAAAAVRASTSLAAPDVRVRTLTDGSPAQERRIVARRVGERLRVVESGAPRPAAAGDVELRIAPGPAFGSADHPTTRGCLRLLEQLVRPGDRVADVGAGTGILAIAAVRLGARRAVALEADAAACRAARENLRENGVDDRIELRHVEVDEAGLRRLGPFEGIAANLATGLLLSLMDALRARLEPGGWLVLSGVPGGERAVVEEVAARASLRPAAEVVEEGWWSAAFRR